MALNWINLNDYSFNSLLMFERFQIRMILENQWIQENLGIALHYNPAVKWIFIHKCPEYSEQIEKLTENTPINLSKNEIRRAEIIVMENCEDFIVYCYPEIMDESCNFIYAWDKAKLFELADFTDKIVLDVGSGSGRLAFAAVPFAKFVIASEPVESLRSYLQDKITRQNIVNMKVSDGMVNDLPFLDNTFDIVMSGHVVGDDYEKEVSELSRVVKSGGWILDCPGENAVNTKPSEFLRKHGWEEFFYKSKLGGDVYRYRKQIFK